ncbi:peptide-methionine (S)-S-oxide reductase MsrA [Saccharibacillus sacchari]|uniref:peptide-methionine (S)-S-oxide reductase MsrA n=1 Tax=Saccharibacillus sacchari TaxID=456493 RepID=UPI000559D8C4|nr:peptide-methionine (S)-S-oxide reductase MsrA [Saccharibacillus sacchari]
MNCEKLTFAMGCFWGPQDRFSRIPGVTGTRVGYSGGDNDSGSGGEAEEGHTDMPPTHRRLNGHSEVVEIEFDPGQVTLEELLEHFWNTHNPSAIEGYKPEDSRYRSLLFYRNEEQQATMERMKQKMTDQGFSSQATGLRAIQPFYPAEEKHQHYEKKKRQKLNDSKSY